MASITEHEEQGITEANESGRTPVVFVHGLWLLPSSWDRWMTVKARAHFPTETAAMKCVYLAVMSLDPTGRGRQRWTNRWKPALNAITIEFPGRIMTSTK